VAALALEISGRLRLPPAENHILEKAALLHHFPPALLKPGSLDRLLTDMLGSGWREAIGGAGLFPEPADREVSQVLEALRQPTRGAVETKALLFAQIVELANLFDEQVEFLPYEYRTVEQILDELRWMAHDGFCHPAVVTALASLPRARKEQLLEIVYRLPVFPAVALKTLALASHEEVNFQLLENLVSSDQVLAGNLLKVANSALFSPVRAISNIRLALSYIGLEAARKVLMAAVLQPLFASGKVKELWKHSLEMAQLAERMARLSGRVNPEEAFLCGLVHDVGRLALEKLSGEVPAAYARLLARGCCPVFAELVLCRFEHGELGADILRVWNFPEHLIDSIRHHHQPEQAESPMASLLYVAEFWSGSEEDLPSALRLARALELTGLSAERLESLEERSGLLDALIRAA
jgi:putative nucleotidyltransferase with HDIG domain